MKQGITSRSITSRIIASSYATDTGSKEALEKLVKANKVVVFMKGNPDAPRCGFSNAVVQILKFHGVDNYDAHDVLQDEDIRQGRHFYYISGSGLIA